MVDAPINVGWGSKQTQFHGSLGKAAAQAPAASSLSSVGVSPDDDLLTRISWRGDGTLFAVSAVSAAAVGATSLRRRVLRVYNRDGALQATAEAVPGLEHPLSWRPSGNLIVSVQRFGTFPGGGKGREGRHDIVFFEKNGLRHGEFGLRHGTLGVGPSDSKERKWGYKVKEVSWSADSNVLLVWIEEDAGDTGESFGIASRATLISLVQLWTTGNYHWCCFCSILTDWYTDFYVGILSKRLPRPLRKAEGTHQSPGTLRTPFRFYSQRIVGHLYHFRRPPC
jgi:elongator complex protein 1